MSSRIDIAAAVPSPGRGEEKQGVRRLTLADFRSYPSLDLALSAPMVVLSGDNGAGKTNVLEALSLLAPGRGLRRADLSELPRHAGGGGFAVSVELGGPRGRIQFGTGLEPRENAPPLRKFRLDREPVASISAFCDHIRVVWLTPSMDGLFTGPAGDRRRFLDRLVLSIDADHGARASALERALRSRNRLLEENWSRSDKTWLDAVEREAAELGVAVAAARAEAVLLLSALIDASRDEASPFPWAALALSGDIEKLVTERPALEAEDIYRAILRDNRAKDAAAGRALIGPQASDLRVRHGPKNIEAAQASTGEQKALLIGLVLAQARLVASVSGIAPLILLDEIAAHLDPSRRKALYDLLEALGGQVWLTGADPAAFAGIETRAQMLKVTPGCVEPLA